MSRNIIEYLRMKNMESLYSMASFSNSWSYWKEDIKRILNISDENNIIKTEDIINLGDKLEQVFKGTGVAGRSQSSLSGGGYAWEGLVAWYLNLCLVGTRAVVVKYKKEFVPEAIRKLLSVKYGNFTSNTESDLLLLVFPNSSNYLNSKFEISINNVPVLKETFNHKKVLDDLAEEDLDKFSVGVIQCKTNWNDNAQIPMLWDMVYTAEGFRNPNIKVGDTIYNLERLKSFSYAFVTVPSNNNTYTRESTAVLRVRQLSGGNYWGKESTEGVAQSIKEYIENNILSELDESLYKSITKNKEEFFDGKYDYFLK